MNKKKKKLKNQNLYFWKTRIYIFGKPEFFFFFIFFFFLENENLYFFGKAEFFRKNIRLQLIEEYKVTTY